MAAPTSLLAGPSGPFGPALHRVTDPPSEEVSPLRSSAALLLAALLLIPQAALAADEIHWTFTGPTSISVDWRGSETTLRYGLTSAYGSTVTAQTPSPLPFSSSGPFKVARVSGLLPGTTYHYSIGTGADHFFHTPPSGPTTFTVYAEGDIGDTTSYSRVGAVQRLIASGAPDFVLTVGDLTYGNPNGQSKVDIAFNNIMSWSTDAADMAAWGNHEWDVPANDDLRNYKGRFDFPNPRTSPSEPSPTGTGEDWYWFDYGQVRFINYPEPYVSSDFSDWNTRAKAVMDSAQSNPAIRYIITFGHRPAYSSAHHPGESDLKGYLDALGTSHSKYVLNINGHSHNYERTYPQHGVIHLTVGTGGGTLEEDKSGSCLYLGGCPAPSWSAFRAYHHGALKLRITPTSIHGYMMCGPAGDSGSNYNDVSCTYGAVMDSFTIGTDPTTGVEPAPIADLSFGVRQIRPNPAASVPVVTYALPSAAPASLELVDVSGRVIARQDLGTPGPGLHEARLGMRSRPAPGVYWVRLSQGERSVSSTVIFVR